MSPTKHLLPLTSLRFFAAIWVVFFHLSGPRGLILTDPATLRPLYNLVRTGYVAVGIFFVLSGFVLAYTYRGEFSARQFWTARIARIYPVYFLGLVLILPVVVASVLRHMTTWLWAGGSGLACVLLLQSWCPRTALAWNHPGWSLSVEAFFYLLFPLILLPLKRLAPRGLFVAVGLSLVAALASCPWRPSASAALSGEIPRSPPYPPWMVGSGPAS